MHMFLIGLTLAASLQPAEEQDLAARAAMLQAQATDPAQVPAQTCASKPADMAAAEAALLEPEPSAIAIQLIQYRTANAAGLPDCQGD